MAQFGGQITGIDASETSIEVAQNHLREKSKHFEEKITYKQTSLEDFLRNSSQKFDVVMAMEIIEHVDNCDTFLQNLGRVCKPNGLLFISSIQKNAMSYLSTILLAEKIMRVIPEGTHSYEKFQDSEKVAEVLRRDFSLVKKQFFIYDIFKEEMVRDNIFGVNYCLAFKKIN